MPLPRVLTIGVLLLWVGATVGWCPLAYAEPFAFITNQKANTVSVVDTATRRVVKTIAVGKEPAGVGVSRDGSRVCITNPGGKSMTLIDGKRLEVVGDLPLGDGPLGIAVDPDGSRAYVADWYQHQVSVVDLREKSDK
jgi:YVTN family beta-propeller protein